MESDLLQVLFGGVLAAVVWFVLGGVLYMNPLVAGFYREASGHPAVRQWESVPKYLLLQFGAILVQAVLWAFVYGLVRSALPQGVWAGGLTFGGILVVTKILPRLIDMAIQTTYPGKLLAVELVNGTIGSLVIGLVLAWVI